MNTPNQNASASKIESWIGSVAQSQYYHRPDDEKYTSLESFREVCETDKKTCRSAFVPAGSLKVTPHGSTIALIGPSGIPAIPTNYGFRQLCSLVGAPASYLPQLPPQLAADCLAHSFEKMEEETKRKRHALYLSSDQLPNLADGQAPESWRLRAITSDEYRRVYDASVAEIACSMRDRYGLDLPPVWEGGQGGAYRSDRNSFVLLTSGGSIVTDPSIGTNDDGRMFRGFMIGNSETGDSTLWFSCFLYRVVCGNHAIWNPRSVQMFNRKHIGRNFVSDFARALDRATSWLESPESTDVQTIQRLIDARLADDQEDAIAKARRISPTLTQTMAERAIAECTRFENCSPLSPWGFVQGLTRISQQTPFADARFALDAAAAKISKAYAFAS
jgi:hypothetical protein